MDAAMTSEKGLLCLKEAIKELSEEDQARVKGCANWLRKIIAGFGDCGLIAMALVGSELTVEQGRQNSSQPEESPLRQKVFELCLAVEELPASEQQTTISVMASNLLQLISAGGENVSRSKG